MDTDCYLFAGDPDDITRSIYSKYWLNVSGSFMGMAAFLSHNGAFLKKIVDMYVLTKFGVVLQHIIIVHFVLGFIAPPLVGCWGGFWGVGLNSTKTTTRGRGTPRCSTTVDFIQKISHENQGSFIGIIWQPGLPFAKKISRLNWAKLVKKQ